MKRETVYAQHSSITSGDITRAMGLSFTPGNCSTETMPRKIAYHHQRWPDRWKQYRRTVANGTFGAKPTKGLMSQAVWEEINKA